MVIGCKAVLGWLKMGKHIKRGLFVLDVHYAL